MQGISCKCIVAGILLGGEGRKPITEGRVDRMKDGPAVKELA